MLIPGNIKIARAASAGSLSSNEDADEKDGNEASFETQSKFYSLCCLSVGDYGYKDGRSVECCHVALVTSFGERN